MFGGLAFMLDGNMCCGIVGDRLMLRLGADLAEQALERANVHPMDFTGRPMTGMVYVAPEGLRGKALRPWVEQAADFARTLPGSTLVVLPDTGHLCNIENPEDFNRAVRNFLRARRS